jgi:hypothetical protein
MPGILGSQSMPPGILGGGYRPIRQIAVPQGQPMQAMPPQVSPFAMAGQGGPPAYGSDEWAMQTGGPGAMIWREIMRAMAGGGHPLAFLDPSKAGKFFSDETRALLAPKYQKQGK